MKVKICFLVKTSYCERNLQFYNYLVQIKNIREVDLLTSPVCSFLENKY
jgi:hypothetical protein